MRTTLTIESDIIEKLQREVALSNKSFKEVTNETLRRGLDFVSKKSSQPYRVFPHSSDFVPGIDPTKLNQLVEELEIQEQFKTQQRQ